MQFRDLKKQYEVLKLSIDAAIHDVIVNTSFISGPQVAELERQLAAYVGRKHCITCGNGTDALSMALMAWGIKEGDAVFVPDFTFFATGEVVSFEGATPIFVDVDEDTFNMDVEKLEEAIKVVLEEGKLVPKLVIPVDLFGLPADYEKIEAVAKKYDLKVLEDGAQGFGGSLNGKRSCAFGEISTTSFFPAKPLGCYGDGGAVFTDDDEISEYLKSIRVHGKGSHKYENIRIGWNSRLDTLQAAILLSKLKAFQDYELEKVNKVAENYETSFRELQHVMKTPAIPESFYSSWAQYTIQVKDREIRDRLQNFLKEREIPTMIYYPIPMHRQKAFEGNKLYQLCPVTDKLCETVLSLPIHPYMELEEQNYIIDSVKEFFG